MNEKFDRAKPSATISLAEKKCLWCLLSLPIESFRVKTNRNKGKKYGERYITNTCRICEQNKQNERRKDRLEKYGDRRLLGKEKRARVISKENK